MNRAGDIALLRRAAELIEADATELRQSHNVNAQQPEWDDEPEARAAHDEALSIAVGLHMLANRIESNEPANSVTQHRQEDDIERARRLT